jgi:exodeoxyribonuclease VII large subunit
VDHFGHSKTSLNQVGNNSGQTPEQKIYNVSELNQKARMLLESEFLNVWISGEISNLVKATSGHWYLTLKDQKAQIKGAMFKGNNRQVRANIENGTQVLVRGRLSLYEPRGDYQLIIEYMEPAGAGLLKQQFEQLKLKLLQMGMFDQTSKQAIPPTPKRVGLVTSPTGAAVHDILTVLKRRSPQTEVILYPTMVQGEHAADNIMWAIDTANFRQEVDVLIVGRGGGSLEDLWCFNDEGLAHTIFNSALPIISAVGHEVDVSIADFVADMRAPTPSAAAELVSTDNSELTHRVTNLHNRLLRAYAHQHQANKNQFVNLKRSLSLLHPSYQLQLSQQKTDELQLALNRAIKQKIQGSNQQYNLAQERLLSTSPKSALALAKQRLEYAANSLPKQLAKLLSESQQRYARTVDKLNVVSPLATLTRGYSIATHQGKVLTQSEDVDAGDLIDVKLSKGSLQAVVQNTEKLKTDESR